MQVVLGLDAGATKTYAMVADLQGNILGAGKAKCGNFQCYGVRAAQVEVKAAIDRALATAGVREDQVAAAYYGMAGADRQKDFQIIEGFLVPINPAKEMLLENDCAVALMVGTRDGVGVGVICGTGTNCIAYNAQGERAQIGGFGYLLGDYAGAGHIGGQAIRRAMRGYEGRGKETLLYPMLCEALDVEELVDIVEFGYEGSTRHLDLPSLCPLVFEAANQGDEVALEILRDVGRELGVAANAAIAKLFGVDDAVKVVLGGSVAQKGENPAMIDALRDEVTRVYPHAQVIVPELDPVFGAMMWALKLAGVEVTDEIIANLVRSFERVKGVVES